MRWNNKCDCKHGAPNFEHIKFKMNGSVIELKCTKCMSLIGWWHPQVQKIMLSKRKWSKAECLAMRWFNHR